MQNVLKFPNKKIVHTNIILVDTLSCLGYDMAGMPKQFLASCMEIHTHRLAKPSGVVMFVKHHMKNIPNLVFQNKDAQAKMDDHFIHELFEAGEIPHLQDLL